MILERVLLKMASDPMIGPVHICLYCVMYHLAGGNLTFHFRKAAVMEASKIKGLATYHSALRTLHKSGYLDYEPSYDSRRPNLISFKTV